MTPSLNTAGATRATLNDPRWEAIVARDPRANGLFVYGVKSTGIYCQPSCPSRTAKPHNVRFYSAALDAEKAGFRPCKRCRPDQPTAVDRGTAKVADACRLIESADEPPSLEELAMHVGMSRFHFHRLFKAATGLTPKEYANAHRAGRLREMLSQSETVTEAIYDAGFNSNGRFYETADRILGMTPTNYRAGGTATTIRFAVGDCSLGSILVAQSDRGVCAILLGDDPEALLNDLQDRFPQAELRGGEEDFEEIVAKVVGFVEAPQLGLDLPLDIRGTAFQQRVWQALRELPSGSTASYTEIAHRIGSPKSVRAVAGACAANPLAVAIPCHRVVRSDGGLSGYRWGIERKRRLIDREADC